MVPNWVGNTLVEVYTALQFPVSVNYVEQKKLSSEQTCEEISPHLCLGNLDFFSPPRRERRTVLGVR